MAMHNNSLDAYHDLRTSVGIRQERVLTVIERHPDLTDRQILYKLDGREMNEVRPRISELIKLGLVTESGSSKCGYTGRTVRTLRAVDFNPKGQLDLFA